MSTRNSLFSACRIRKPLARVSWSDEWDAWVLANYADVARILSDRRFSANVAALHQQAGQLPIENDIAAAVPAALQLIRKRLVWIRTQIDRSIQADCRKWHDQSNFDLQQDLILPCCQELALCFAGCETPGTDAETLLTLADTVFLTIHTDKARADAATAELVPFFQGILARSRQNPRDDLISAFAAIDQTASLLSPVIQMFVGLATSLPLLLGNALLALLVNLDQRNNYLESPSSKVSELLRIAGPSQVVFRTALQDAVVGVHRFQRGDRLALLLAHANRDRQMFADPEKLDFSRKSVPHLSLGRGTHTCVGAPIIKAAVEIFPYHILSCFPQMTVDVENTSWGGSPTIQGILALPVVNRDSPASGHRRSVGL